MNVLRVMLKYVGYYIMIMLLISIFAAASVKGMLGNLCGAALSISMFAAIIQLLFSGSVAEVAQKISTWCFRGTIITTVIVIITGIGIGNIVKIFSGS